MGNSFDLSPLPLNFPQTFLPDRRLLARLLPFAAAKGGGDKVQIGEKTGIPTGESTGKVEPMIHYARGMGLIRTEKDGARWKLNLTPLGHLISHEDPYLSEPVTLWLLHLLLCRRSPFCIPAAGLADAWFTLFAEGGLRLGNRFDQGAFLNSLIERHGARGYLKGLSGLVLRCYLEQTCFGPIKALTVDETDSQAWYSRRAAPEDNCYFPAYSVFLFLVWDAFFANENQIAIDDLFEQTRLLAVLGWDRPMASRWLDWMADRGQLQLDRQTGKTLALRLQNTEAAVAGIFDELI